MEENLGALRSREAMFGAPEHSYQADLLSVALNCRFSFRWTLDIFATGL